MKKYPHELLEDLVISAIQNPKIPRAKKIEEADNIYFEDLQTRIHKFCATVNADSTLTESQKKMITDTAKKEVSTGFYHAMSHTVFSFLDGYSYLLAKFHRASGKVVVIDPTLVDALYSTDIKLKGNEIKYPFKNAIIYFDENKTIPCCFMQDPEHMINIDVSGVIVSIYENIDQGRMYLQYVLLHSDPGKSQEDLRSWNNTNITTYSYPNDSTEFSLRTTQLTLTLDKYPTLSPVQRFEYEQKAAGLINLIFNIMLYIQECGDIQVIEPQLMSIEGKHNKGKIAKALKYNERQGHYAVSYIGKGYSGRYQKSAEAAEHSGIPLTHRVLVRGHWRMQWYGKHTTESPGTKQVRIWIEPYFKGFEFEDTKLQVLKLQ